MNNKLLIALSGIVLVVAISLAGCAIQPEEERVEDGIWCYTPTGVLPVVFDPYEGDSSKAFMQASYVSEWTGTFTGDSVDYGLAVAHILSPDPEMPPVPMTFTGTSTFPNVEVEGKVGSLEMNAIGDRTDPTADWDGTWVITSGSGELEGFRAHGAFWGPGWLGDFDECGVIYYSVDEMGFGGEDEG